MVLVGSTCSVCMEDYGDLSNANIHPQCPPCGHSFCSKCLGVYANKCPMRCPLPATYKAKDLGVNRLAQDLIQRCLDLQSEKKSFEESTPSNSSVVVVVCDNCSRGIAENHCTDCTAFLCKACCRQIHQNEIFSRHEVVCLVHSEKQSLCCASKGCLVCRTCSSSVAQAPTAAAANKTSAGSTTSQPVSPPLNVSNRIPSSLTTSPAPQFFVSSSNPFGTSSLATQAAGSSRALTSSGKSSISSSGASRPSSALASPAPVSSSFGASSSASAVSVPNSFGVSSPQASGIPPISSKVSSEPSSASRLSSAIVDSSSFGSSSSSALGFLSSRAIAVSSPQASVAPISSNVPSGNSSGPNRPTSAVFSALPLSSSIGSSLATSSQASRSSSISTGATTARSPWDLKADAIVCSNKDELRRACIARIQDLLPVLHEDLDVTREFILEHSKIYKSDRSTPEEKFQSAFMLAELGRASADW
eukprot:TRINITY_DN4647_c0_g2_i1.p1 TRINITY_DN4647_c0_g2~~TRINITY_DN4647_c0_g2_i1.p1  ORF type:complete len:475 (+),score=70.59 TRINITY_DN4647_c0_g2_i1:36-1460(+)